MATLSNKVIWVTGASSGIGEALAYELTKLGNKVILSSRQVKELERVRNSCEGEAKVLPLDLGKADELQQKVIEAWELYGKIDVLINNAGVSQRDYIINTTPKVDRQLMEINYFGTVALSKYLLPKFVKQQSGQFVVVTSAVGIVSTPLRSTYSAAKHALHGFFDTLRAEHHQDNIGVTIVCPGYVHTKISYNALMGSGEKHNVLNDAQANGLTPEFVAKKMIKIMARKKQEAYIGGLKEVGGIYLKRFWPYMYSIVVRKVRVT